MKSKIFIPAIILMLLITNIHCNKDDGSSDFFIPVLDNQWTNKVDDTNTFFFLVNDANKNTSTLTGNENLPGGGQDHFTGSFTNHNIQFTYDNGSSDDKSGKTYAGTINDASTVITLQSNDLGNLVLEKR